MNHTQQELRRNAAQSFMESLEQLGQSLAEPENAPQQPTSKSGQDKAAALAYEKALEEAAADIEQFIRSKGCGE